MEKETKTEEEKLKEEEKQKQELSDWIKGQLGFGS
jgi:hypothetical protein